MEDDRHTNELDAAAEDAKWELPGYTHGRELGAGAAGRVVMAGHDATGMPVAIKYLTGEQANAENFRAEAELLAQLDSPHVARLYEYVEGPQGCAIVMELVEGVSLRDLLNEEGATQPEAALCVLKGSLLGLAAAHEAGVVHRDYKPGNVLITVDGGSKLVDFGIAVRTGDSGNIAGTPAYMAPEQWAGEAASPAGDVYAATATFFECLTGAKPYSGTTLMELAVQHTEAEIPDEQAPEALRPLIRAGLAKTPEERPLGAAQLVTQLEAVAGQALGKDWEERGRRQLAALAALLPLLLPSGGAPAAGTTSLATTTLGPALPGAAAAGRLGRKAKLVGAAMGVVLVGGALAGVAMAGAGDASGTTDVAAPRITTSLIPGATPSVSASDTVTPTPSASPSASASVTATASALAPTPSAKSGAPAPAPAPVPVPAPGGPTVTPTAPGTPTPPPPPALHVKSVTVSNVYCNQGYLFATVTVNSDGAADGWLDLAWIERAGRTQTTVATPAPIKLSQGQTQFSQSYERSFIPDYNGYWGLRATTTPGADSGPGYGEASWCPRLT